MSFYLHDDEHFESMLSLHKKLNGKDYFVFTNGCFDILHPGHLRLLLRCKVLAKSRGTVIVGLNSDDSIKRLKGACRPIFSLDERAEMLSHLHVVDIVTAFEEDTPYELIKKIRPKYIVKGGDYKREDVVGNDIAEFVEIFPIIDDWSTTKIIERIKNG